MSYSCYGFNNVRKRTVTCEICGRPFETSSRIAKYCKRPECQAEIKARRIASGRWEWQRKKAYRAKAADTLAVAEAAERGGEE